MIYHYLAYMYMALALSDTHTHTYIHMHTHTLTHSHLLVFFLVARLAPRHEGHSHSLRVLLVCDGCTHTHIEMYVRTCMPRHYGYTLSLTHTHRERCTHTHTHTHSHTHTHTRAVPTHASPSSLTNVCARKGLSFSPITALRPGPTCADQTRVHCACYSLLKPHTLSLSPTFHTIFRNTHTYTHTHSHLFADRPRCKVQVLLDHAPLEEGEAAQVLRKGEPDRLVRVRGLGDGRRRRRGFGVVVGDHSEEGHEQHLHDRGVGRGRMQRGEHTVSERGGGCSCVRVQMDAHCILQLQTLATSTQKWGSTNGERSYMRL
jgi:hypothetical protein